MHADFSGGPRTPASAPRTPAFLPPCAGSKATSSNGTPKSPASAAAAAAVAVAAVAATAAAAAAQQGASPSSPFLLSPTKQGITSPSEASVNNIAFNLERLLNEERSWETMDLLARNSDATVVKIIERLTYIESIRGDGLFERLMRCTSSWYGPAIIDGLPDLGSHPYNLDARIWRLLTPSQRTLVPRAEVSTGWESKKYNQPLTLEQIRAALRR